MRDLFDVSGKVVLVTGGSRGIGEMIARGFVENGATVYISSRKAETCAAIAAELGAFGTCVALPFDLGGVSGIDGLTAALRGREHRLDVLVNNAGANWAAPLDDYPEAGWDKVQSLNLKAPFFLAQRLLPLLRAAARPDAPSRIVNIASIDGINPSNLETYAYTTSKAGCIMLTRHLAKRLASEHILVNAIAPGPFQSQMMRATLERDGEAIRASNPLGRIGTPEDIAGVAMFLSSRASAYTTGAVIPCDGGVAEVAY